MPVITDGHFFVYNILNFFWLINECSFSALSLLACNQQAHSLSLKIKAVENS